MPHDKKRDVKKICFVFIDVLLIAIELMQMHLYCREYKAKAIISEWISLMSKV